jgi:hypothetical protein
MKKRKEGEEQETSLAGFPRVPLFYWWGRGKERELYFHLPYPRSQGFVCIYLFSLPSSTLHPFISR